MLTDTEMASRIAEAVSGGPLSIRELADAMGVTRPAIDQWMRTGIIDYKRLPALANLTGVGLPYFLPEAGSPETASLSAHQWRAVMLVKDIPDSRLPAAFSSLSALGESIKPPGTQAKRA